MILCQLYAEFQAKNWHYEHEKIWNMTRGFRDFSDHFRILMLMSHKHHFEVDVISGYFNWQWCKVGEIGFIIFSPRFLELKPIFSKNCQYLFVKIYFQLGIFDDEKHQLSILSKIIFWFSRFGSWILNLHRESEFSPV